MEDKDVWVQKANTYWSNTTAMQLPQLPPGIYQYSLTPMGSWFLERISTKFEFPYKIYGNNDTIINRVRTAWGSLEGNLGVLLNGVKGTGKTVTAQLLANWVVDQGHPVLLVQNPIPLTDVLQKFNQPVAVLFDEFEKTHNEDEHQQSLLTALDGMARNRHPRLFVFTTNERKVNENLVDRPSRVRYTWEFGRLEDSVIEMLMDDLLDRDLWSFRPEIVSYLARRKVVSIDVAKTVIKEVNLFRESPTVFAPVMNLTEQDVRGFVVEILDQEWKVAKVLTDYFAPHRAYMEMIRGMISPSGQKAMAEQIASGHRNTFQSYSLKVEVVAPTHDPAVWLCKVAVPLYDTWVKKFTKLEERHYSNMVWIDQPRAGWAIPKWARDFQDGKVLDQEQEEELESWVGSETIFGGDQAAEILVRFTPNFEERSYKVVSNFTGIDYSSMD
jgi:hypothetical protein